MKNATSFHGSDLEVIETQFNIPKEEIVNFSGNVNPLGISPDLRHKLRDNIDLIASYPDRQYTSLRNTISDYVDSAFENILVGNGTTELISLSIQAINPKRALIVGPTYSEYEKEVDLNGGTSFYYPLKEANDFEIDIDQLKKELTADMDMLILCNPNNPTSSVIQRGQLRQILDYCKKQGIYVLIDETYVEFVPHLEHVTAVPFAEYYSNLIILRGVSKFYSAPGLRLGYCICGNENIKRRINAKKNPWTINALAALAGEVMLQDEKYIKKTRQLIEEEREYVYNTCKAWPDVKVYTPYANFILLRLDENSPSSKDIFESLIQKRLLIRDASSFPFLNQRYIRFCFLQREDNSTLLAALDQLLHDK